MSGEKPAPTPVTPAQINAMMSELRRQRDTAMDALVSESGKRAQLAETLIEADEEIKRLRAIIDGPPQPAPVPNTIDH